MERWTERQLMIALTWLSLQWNKPNRNDHYLMQIHQAMKQMFAKSPRGILLQHSKVKFKQGRPKRKKKEQGEVFNAAQAILDVMKGSAMSMSAVPVTIRRVSQSGVLLSERLVDPRTGQVLEERTFTREQQ